VLDSHFGDALVECSPCRSRCNISCIWLFNISYVYDEVFWCWLINVGNFISSVSEKRSGSDYRPSILKGKRREGLEMIKTKKER
jgi:hypothetical protein